MDRPSNVTPLPLRRRRGPDRTEPDCVRLGYDFGTWCVELCVGETFRRRHSAVDLASALLEIARFEVDGLRRISPSRDAVTMGAKP